MSTKYNRQHPARVTIDVWVFCLILAASCVAGGYWWGSESRTEVIRIPERVTPSCIQKGALKKTILAYRKEIR